MHHLPFQSLQNISIFFTVLYNIKCHVNMKMHVSLWEKYFVELLLASDCTSTEMTEPELELALDLITKTCLFKYIENFTTKKRKIFW